MPETDGQTSGMADDGVPDEGDAGGPIVDSGMNQADAGPEEMRYSFPGEEVECGDNPDFEALLPILNGGRTHPTGRGEQASAYDACNQRIILFGGNDFQPEECADFGPKRFQGDTWIYSIRHDNWARLDLEITPSPRGRHRMVFDRSRKQIYMFGGRYRREMNSGNYQLFNDLWAFDVTRDRWSQLTTNGSVPSARSNFAMVYDYTRDRVILFGGSTSVSGLFFEPKSDTYILELDTMTWRQVEGASPSARLFHNMVIDSTNDQALMIGGGDENAFTGPFLSDMWAFDLENERWKKVWDVPQSTGPDARINPELVEDPANGRVILFAGHDDTNVGHRNDVWAFDAGTREWSTLVAGDDGRGAGCSSFCSCPPDFVEVDINSPERRQYHTFQSILGADRAILFGGKSDCGYLDDTWSFSFSDNSWMEIEPAGQGEACQRTGQEGCTDLATSF